MPYLVAMYFYHYTLLLPVLMLILLTSNEGSYYGQDPHMFAPFILWIFQFSDFNCHFHLLHSCPVSLLQFSILKKLSCLYHIWRLQSLFVNANNYSFCSFTYCFHCMCSFSTPVCCMDLLHLKVFFHEKLSCLIWGAFTVSDRASLISAVWALSEKIKSIHF